MLKHPVVADRKYDSKLDVAIKNVLAKHKFSLVESIVSHSFCVQNGGEIAKK